MKHAIALALAATFAAGCATAQDARSTTNANAQPAQAQCAPPPKELVIKDLEVGKGRTVENRTPVLVNYTGWLYDGCSKDLKGAQFDTSTGRATPLGFIAGIGNVIDGWKKGVIGMKEQGKRLLVIPPDQAYGEKGTRDGKIPPNATLVFEIELLTIISGPTTQVPRKTQ